MGFSKRDFEREFEETMAGQFWQAVKADQRVRAKNRKWKKSGTDVAGVLTKAFKLAAAENATIEAMKEGFSDIGDAREKEQVQNDLQDGDGTVQAEPDRVAARRRQEQIDSRRLRQQAPIPAAPQRSQEAFAQVAGYCRRDTKRLQEAVIWSEILGEPVSRRRRKKRMNQ